MKGMVKYIQKWGVIITLLLVLKFVFFSNISPFFLNSFNLLNATFNFSEKAIKALPMIFVIMCHTTYPVNFGYFGQGYIGSTLIPFGFVFFLVLTLVTEFVLHFTSYGRKLYSIRKSISTARFSGVSVDRIRFTNFLLNGLFVGFAAIILASRIGSTRPQIASGWDLKAISFVVLGGVAISGGKGKIYGVLVAVFLIGYLHFGTGLMNLSERVMIISIGLLLIIAVMLPNLLEMIRNKKLIQMQQEEG